jgi:hypothetical protein
MEKQDTDKEVKVSWALKVEERLSSLEKNVEIHNSATDTYVNHNIQQHVKMWTRISSLEKNTPNGLESLGKDMARLSSYYRDLEKTVEKLVGISINPGWLDKCLSDLRDGLAGHQQWKEEHVELHRQEKEACTLPRANEVKIEGIHAHFEENGKPIRYTSGGRFPFHIIPIEQADWVLPWKRFLEDKEPSPPEPSKDWKEALRRVCKNCGNYEDDGGCTVYGKDHLYPVWNCSQFKESVDKSCGTCKHLKLGNHQDDVEYYDGKCEVHGTYHNKRCNACDDYSPPELDKVPDGYEFPDGSKSWSEYKKKWGQERSCGTCKNHAPALGCCIHGNDGEKLGETVHCGIVNDGYPDRWSPRDDSPPNALNPIVMMYALGRVDTDEGSPYTHPLRDGKGEPADTEMESLNEHLQHLEREAAGIEHPPKQPSPAGRKVLMHPDELRNLGIDATGTKNEEVFDDECVDCDASPASNPAECKQVSCSRKNSSPAGKGEPPEKTYYKCKSCSYYRQGPRLPEWCVFDVPPDTFGHEGDLIPDQATGNDECHVYEQIKQPSPAGNELIESQRDNVALLKLVQEKDKENASLREQLAALEKKDCPKCAIIEDRATQEVQKVKEQLDAKKQEIIDLNAWGLKNETELKNQLDEANKSLAITIPENEQLKNQLAAKDKELDDLQSKLNAAIENWGVEVEQYKEKAAKWEFFLNSIDEDDLDIPELKHAKKSLDAIIAAWKKGYKEIYFIETYDGWEARALKPTGDINQPKDEYKLEGLSRYLGDGKQVVSVETAIEHLNADIVEQKRKEKEFLDNELGRNDQQQGDDVNG